MNEHRHWTPVFDRIPEEKRNRILASAVAEFATRGFSAASTAAIAEAAGISIGSLFKYFRTKEDLYLAVVELGLQTLDETLRPIVESGEPLLTKVERIVDAAFASRGVHDDLNRLYNRFTTEADADLANRLSRSLEGLTAEAYSRMIAEAQDRGEIRRDLDPRVAAFLLDNILLMLQFSMSNEYYRDRLALYVGPRTVEDDDTLKRAIMTFLRSAFAE